MTLARSSCAWIVLVVLGSVVGCAPAAPADEGAEGSSDDALTARGSGMGKPFLVPGVCKSRDALAQGWEAVVDDAAHLTVVQGQGTVSGRVFVNGFGDVDVPLRESDGWGETDTTRFGDPVPTQGAPITPRRELHAEVKVAGGNAYVHFLRTDEVVDAAGIKTIVTECDYEAPTTIWLDRNDTPSVAPESNFPAGTIRASGLCMGTQGGRLRMVPCDVNAPRWVLSKDDQLVANGKCIQLGSFPDGSKYASLGPCTGRKAYFVVSKIATGSSCMPTVVTMNVWATNKVSGRTTVGCNNVAGGIGSWELRSNGRLCQRDRVGACLEREGRFARVVQSGVPGTPARWEFLKGGRIRQVGTNECVQEGSSHNMEMVSCAGTVRPWRLNGSFSVEGFGNLKASPGLNGAVTGTRFADQEWELNF